MHEHAYDWWVNPNRRIRELSGTHYVLIDPHDNTIRYVGFTLRTLHARLIQHCSDINRYLKYHKDNENILASLMTPKEWWVYRLRQKGLKPIIQELPNCFTEVGWIAYFIEQGEPLLNSLQNGNKRKRNCRPLYLHGEEMNKIEFK